MYLTYSGSAAASVTRLGEFLPLGQLFKLLENYFWKNSLKLSNILGNT